MNIGRAFGSVAGITLLSRLSGFFRVAVFAAYFGSGQTADIFLSVMILPELLYRFAADGLISSAAVPQFVRLTDQEHERRRLFWTLFWAITGISLISIFLFLLFAEPICGTMVPGFVPAARQRMVSIWRIIVPYLLFSLHSALFTAFLNSSGSFALPAIGPILVNLVIIAGILAGGGESLELIAASVVAGIALQFCWLFWLSWGWDITWLSPLRRDLFSREYLTEFASQTMPVACWIFLSPIIPLFERYLLSSQPEGSVSILNYTDKLLFLPLGIISISLSSVIFPLLARNTGPAAERLLHRSLWSMTACILPIGLVLSAGAPFLSDIIFKRGQFGATEVALTADLLRIYAFALLPLSATMLLNRLFFAKGNYRVPFLAGLLAILVQVVCDTVLVERLGSVGVAWGAFLAAMLQTLLLLLGMRGLGGVTSPAGAALPMLFGGIVSVLALHPLAALFQAAMPMFPETKLGRLLCLGGIYGILQMALALLFFRTLRDLLTEKFSSRNP
jgi:putative peptidoglycan lipid II flippase